MSAAGIPIQIIMITIIIPILCGLAGDRIVNSKGYTKGENHGFLWGFLSSIIGIALFFVCGLGILWGSFLGIVGIVVCCVKPMVNSLPKGSAVINTSPKSDSVSEQIKEINKLKEEGFITEEEYEAKKKQILGI